MSPSRETILSLADWLANTPMLRAGVAAQPRGRDSALVHQPPAMPVMIDETETDPRGVREFNGEPLVTVVDGDALDGRMLHIFSTKRQAAEYVEAGEAPGEKTERHKLMRGPGGSVVRGSLTQALTAGPPPGGGFYEMYQLEDLGGCYWRILEWDGLTFNYSTKFACGFLWWGWISADMRVSSIDSYVSADHILIWDMANMTGNLLWIATGVFRINRMADLGWDDRARSQFHLYT